MNGAGAGAQAGVAGGRGRIGRRPVVAGLMGGLATMALAACGEMPAPAGQRGVENGATASALGISITVVPGEVTEPLNGAVLFVEQGKPTPTELTLNTSDATVLHVVNRDEQSYLFQIASLVDPTTIAPKTTTIVGFTSPDSGQYAGSLRSADGANTLGQFTVNVQSS
jgi:hypothetical protein